MTSQPEIANNLKSAVSVGLQGFIDRAELEQDIKGSFDQLDSAGRGKVLDWAEKTFSGKKWKKDEHDFKYRLLPQLTDQERSSLFDEIRRQGQQ